VDYFWIDTDWDASLNSPWDALWYEGGDKGLGCLDGSLSLAGIWKSPAITFEKRAKRPDVYGFVLHYAITEPVRKLWAPIVRDEAEFLPLAVPDVGPVYVVHPLWPVDFDEHAEVSCASISGNITKVTKYSFTLNPKAYDGPRHLFRMRQAKGSRGRDNGRTLNTLIISETIKRVSEEARLTGIAFRYACSA
jgi:hypothetical protein